MHNRMKNLLTSLLCLAAFTAWGQTDILDARTNYSVGQTVTVTGIVTSDPMMKKSCLSD